MADFAIYGAGTMATAMSVLLASNDYSVIMYARRDIVAKAINEKRRNIEYMPEITLSEKIKATSNLEDWIKSSEKVVLAVPSHAVLEFCKKLKSKKEIMDNVWLSVVKGIDNISGKTISQTFISILGIDEEKIAILSGPNFAIEIVKKVPTLNIIASKSIKTLSIFSKALTTDYFVLKFTDDVIGAEVGGVLKNIGAIAMGIIDGLNLGDNTRGAMFSQCLRELLEIGTKVFGARLETLLDLSLLGDLVATGFSDKSRNRIVGLLFSKGVRNIPNDTFISEGRNSVKIINSLAHKMKIDTPLIDFVDSVLSGVHPAAAFHSLWENIKAHERG